MACSFRIQECVIIMGGCASAEARLRQADLTAGTDYPSPVEESAKWQKILRLQGQRRSNKTHWR